jgi:hypothetical protein
MALKDLIKPQASPPSTRPPGISCDKYLLGDAGSTRCAHYRGGACALATEFMCVEWLRLNGPDAPHHSNPERPERPSRRQ